MLPFFFSTKKIKFGYCDNNETHHKKDKCEVVHTAKSQDPVLLQSYLQAIQVWKS